MKTLSKSKDKTKTKNKLTVFTIEDVPSKKKKVKVESYSGSDDEQEIRRDPLNRKKKKLSPGKERTLQFRDKNKEAEPGEVRKRKKIAQVDDLDADLTRKMYKKEDSKSFPVQTIIPKVKKETTAVVKISEGDKLTLSKLSKLRKKGLRSIIATDVEKIHQLIEVGDTDTASTLIYKRMLQALIDAIPHMETRIHKTKGVHGSHQMQVMVSSIRDIMIDIQQAQDRGLMGEHLVERVIRPTFLDVAMFLMTEYESIMQKFKRDMDPDDWKRYCGLIETSQERVGHFMHTKYGEVKEETRKFLQR